jgi:hypothetical protein
LTPRKVNTLFSSIASEVKISEEAVSDIISFYWKEVRKELEEPEHITLRLEHFGTFEIRKKQVIYMIDKYKSLIKYMKPTTYNKHAMLDSAAKKLEKLEKILIKCEEQELKKKQIREIQKNGKTI